MTELHTQPPSKVSPHTECTTKTIAKPGMDELLLDAVVVEDTLVCRQDGLACGEVNTHVLSCTRHEHKHE